MKELRDKQLCKKQANEIKKACCAFGRTFYIMLFLYRSSLEASETVLNSSVIKIALPSLHRLSC